jgi:hypothetical protein
MSPQDVCDLIEAHFAARAADRALAARLEDRAQQFRSVQKRLLVRYKVRRRGASPCWLPAGVS